MSYIITTIYKYIIVYNTGIYIVYSTKCIINTMNLFIAEYNTKIYYYYHIL